MMTVTGFMIVAAFICTIAHALGKCPLWVAVLLLCLALLLGILPR